MMSEEEIGMIKHLGRTYYPMLGITTNRHEHYYRMVLYNDRHFTHSKTRNIITKYKWLW